MKTTIKVKFTDGTTDIYTLDPQDLNFELAGLIADEEVNAFMIFQPRSRQRSNLKISYMIITMTIGRRGRARSCSDSRDCRGLMVQCGTAGEFLRVPGKWWQLFDMKSLANINGRNAPTFGASAGDGLPALMMADRKEYILGG